jgi:hypothetical protein
MSAPILTREEIADAARPLVRAFKERMPADFIDAPSEEVEVTRTTGGTVGMRVKGLWFFLGANGLLCAKREDTNGDPEFGTVQRDGRIAWGRVILNWQTGN